MESPEIKLENKFKNEFGSISKVANEPILVLTSLKSYIPESDFKNLFKEVGNHVKKEKIKKLIFDKRSLNTFNQPSMTWYYVEWKEAMFPLGLTHHRKILPEDKMFQKSVEIGRSKIVKDNPGFSIDKYDLQYCSSVEEAINK